MGPDVKAAQEALGADFNFWSNFVHHLRNTIGTIASVADFCRHHPVDAQKMLTVFAHIENSAQSAMQHLDEFTRLLRPLRMTPRPISLEPWLREIVSLHPISGVPSIKIQWRMDGAASLEADPLRLQQALWALLDNSQEEMTGGGTLTISAAMAQGRVRLDIANTGAPIPPAVQPQIWEPFFTTKVNRMGAGLSWVRKIAQSHGGSIQVENASRGVEFSLCIPAKR